MHTSADLEQAITCLTRFNSFVEFEKLEGTLSHLSRVYHTVCVERPFALVSAWDPEISTAENLRRTADLLLDLRDNSIGAIELRGYRQHEHDSVEDQPELAFFCTDAYDKDGKYKSVMLSLCQKFGQPGVAVLTNNQIRVLNPNGAVLKIYTRSDIQPSHIKRIWSSMIGRNVVRVESGQFCASPGVFCYPLYNESGLISDVTGGSRKITAYSAGRWCDTSK